MTTAKEVQKILKIILMSIGFLIIFYCACTHLRPFIDISPAQADKIIHTYRGNSHFIILDVRTVEEYAPEHLDGAINLDFKAAGFAARLDSLDKSATYLVYCRSGGRSAKAMALMKANGFKRVYNLQGGIIRWKEESRSLQIR